MNRKQLETSTHFKQLKPLEVLRAANTLKIVSFQYNVVFHAVFIAFPDTSK